MARIFTLDTIYSIDLFEYVVVKKLSDDKDYKYMIIDDTFDFGKEPLPLETEENKKFREELVRKMKLKYMKRV